MGLVNPSIQESAFNMIGAALKSHYLIKRHSLLVWLPSFNAVLRHAALQHIQEISSARLRAST
jgi:hypothetical protein